MPKPDVDEITGLSPAISIDQKSRSNNPRSTVATITEIYDYLRVLYARVGHPHCPECGEEIKKLSNEEIISFVLEKVTEYLKQNAGSKKKLMGVAWNDTPVSIFAPLIRGRKGEHYQMLYDLLGKGFGQIRLDGSMKDLRDRIELSKNKAHNIDVLVDTFALHEFKDNKEGSRARLSEAVERALRATGSSLSISALVRNLFCHQNLPARMTVFHFQKSNHDFSHLTHPMVPVQNVMVSEQNTLQHSMNVKPVVASVFAVKRFMSCLGGT
jgi:excinuclease ABC subunit A